MRIFFLSLVALLYPLSLLAQIVVIEPEQEMSDTSSSDWSFAAAGYYYILPDEENTATILGYADYKSFHMEARYNYEDVKTASVFGGYRFEAGNKLIFGATPMIGIVFGNTNAVAPGLLIDITWEILDFYSESEYIFDFEGSENNYFYTWSELAVTPFENFRTGIVADRTKLFQSDLEFERGVFAQYSFWKLTAGLNYFNPFSDEDFVIATLGIEF